MPTPTLRRCLAVAFGFAVVVAAAPAAAVFTCPGLILACQARPVTDHVAIQF
jgi:hypothetical protein